MTRKTTSKLLAAILLSLSLSATTLLAQAVPQLVNYQGQLTDAAGTALPTADHKLSFAIYNQPERGEPIWGPQVFQKVPVVQGYFNVMLGPNDSQNRPIAQTFNGASAYVEIKVGDNPALAPRQQILSTPYAFRASDSANLNGADWTALFGVNSPSGTLLPAKIADGSLPGGKVQPGSISTAQLAAGGVTADKIAGGAVTAQKLDSSVIIPIVTAWGNAYAFGSSLKNGVIFSSRSRRVGDTLEVQAAFIFTEDVSIAANSDGGVVGVLLPSEALIDESKIPGPSHLRVVCGSWKYRTPGGANYSGVCWIGTAAAGNRLIAIEIDGSRTSTIPNDKFRKDDALTVKFDYPVKGWTVTK